MKNLNNRYLNKLQTRYKHHNININPWFITGLIDAEGCFLLNFRENSKYKQNFQVSLMFTISLHEKDKNLLINIQNFFGVGSILNHGPNSLQYRVTSIKELLIIISHFYNYPLISKKRLDYELFKNAYSIILNKEHLTEKGFK